MVNISLKKYMIIDLLMLSAGSVIVELMGQYLIPKVMMNATPFFVITMLMVILATSRWKFKGLSITPILVLSSFVGGRFFGETKDVYWWQFVISTFAGLLAGGLFISVLETKMKTKKLFSGAVEAFGIAFLSSLIILLVTSLTYSLVTLQNPISCFLLVISQSLFGLLFAWLGTVVLRRQDVVGNVREKLEDEAREKEYEEKYYKQQSSEVIIRNNLDKNDKNDDLDQSHIKKNKEGRE